MRLKNKSFLSFAFPALLTLHPPTSSCRNQIRPSDSPIATCCYGWSLCAIRALDQKCVYVLMESCVFPPLTVAFFDWLKEQGSLKTCQEQICVHHARLFYECRSQTPLTAHLHIKICFWAYLRIKKAKIGGNILVNKGRCIGHTWDLTWEEIYSRKHSNSIYKGPGVVYTL